VYARAAYNNSGGQWKNVSTPDLIVYNT
jgi:hypothetical protein